MFFLAVCGGALAKPSYLICLLPAVAILAAIRFLLGAPISPGAMLIGFGLPAVAVLAWQYLQVFAGSRGVVQYGDTIMWAPLRFMHHWASGLVVKFLVSTAFPLTVLILYWRTALRDGMLQLAWSTFFFGAAYIYLLSEKIRWYHGNFGWSAYIALFLVFTASMVFWLRKISAMRLRGGMWWRELVCFAVLGAHVTAGVLLDKAYLTWAIRSM